MRMFRFWCVLSGIAIHVLSCAAKAVPAFRVPGFDPNGVRFDVTNLVERAKANDAAANYDLGVMFLCGHQVPRNRYVAYEYFTRSSDLGFGPASLLLGWCREFGGAFKERGLSLCENHPHRALIAERGECVVGLFHPDDGLSPREYYARAVSNGVAEAENFLNRLEKARIAEERRVRAFEAATKRIASGDCRNEEEREVYRRQVESERKCQERQKQQMLAHDEQVSNRVAAVEREAIKLHADQVYRLGKVEFGYDADELYWAACFLRAWAATADGDDPNRRVELARRALGCLRRASERGHPEASFRLGLMLWGGDAHALGPDPAGRGGFLGFDLNDHVMREWVPDRLEVVKPGDVAGPAFGPIVHVRTISSNGSVTNVEKVLVYRQDVKLGLELIRKAAKDGCKGASSWILERQENSLADDLMPWELDEAEVAKPTASDVLEFRVMCRSTDYLGGIFRTFRYDRNTGELVGRSAEYSQREGVSPWR